MITGNNKIQVCPVIAKKTIKIFKLLLDSEKKIKEGLKSRTSNFVQVFMNPSKGLRVKNLKIKQRKFIAKYNAKCVDVTD